MKWICLCGLGVLCARWGCAGFVGFRICGGVRAVRGWKLLGASDRVSLQPLTEGAAMVRARCGRCNVLMVVSRVDQVKIWDCLVCGRAVLTGSPADVLAYERRMLANGFVRLK